MTPAEKLRVLLFLTSFVTVYVLAGIIVIRRLLHKAERVHPLQVLSQRVVLGLAAGGLLCVAYGYFIEPHWLQVRQVRLRTEKLRPGNTIRIVHISDLHSERRPRLEERLPQVVAEQEPDIIFFTGDALNTPGGLPVLRTCLARLARIAPTFAVKGNWDVWYWQRLPLFAGTGVRELNGEARAIDIGDSVVWVAGVAVGNEKSLERSLVGAPANAYTVFLYHYPDLMREVSLQGVDLYCAGHTHGGQVALPLYGALVTLSRSGKRYESGLYREGKTWLNVNRGIGMEGGAVPRVRFLARPEVTVIEISAAGR